MKVLDKIIADENNAKKTRPAPNFLKELSI